MLASPLQSLASPIQDYPAALDRIQAMQSVEVLQPGFDPALKTILLTHGHKTRRAVLWFHGYTAAAPQFRPLAELCFERGYNVLIPCLPHHGFRDRMSVETSQMKTQELAQVTAAMVDLMHALGDDIVVGGLSMGGALACWVAQERADVKTVVIVAPFLGARIIPTHLTRVVAHVTQFVLDIRQWWDPKLKEDLAGPDYGYVQHSTRSLGQILKLGFQVADAARRRPPAVADIWMVLNDNDKSVNNEMAERLAASWQKAGAKSVCTFRFPAALGLPHDLISIEQPHANPQLVYSELIKMVR
jgi:esterase/lipase